MLLALPPALLDRILGLLLHDHDSDFRWVYFPEHMYMVKNTSKDLNQSLKRAVTDHARLMRAVADDVHRDLRRVFPRGEVNYESDVWDGCTMVRMDLSQGDCRPFLCFSERDLVSIRMLLWSTRPGGSDRVRFSVSYDFKPETRWRGVVDFGHGWDLPAPRGKVSYRGTIVDVLCNLFALPWDDDGFIPREKMRFAVDWDEMYRRWREADAVV